MKYGTFAKSIIEDCDLHSREKFIIDLENLEQCLRILNIINSSEKLLEFVELWDWSRGGAETFNAAAKILLNTKTGVHERWFLGKAIVTIGLPLEETVQTWISRRAKIGKHIRVPSLYSYFKGVIYEEYIPDPITRFIEHRPLARNKLRKIAFVAAKIDKLGFWPTNFLSNFMCKHENVY
jgi:hypothetical protein